MKILIVKTSSMGDVIHTLPAVTDAVKANPDLKFDWVVEKVFSEIPRWHPAVEKIIPVSLRRWRKEKFKALVSGEVGVFLRDLRSTQYDLIIDAQGLMKSALIARCARGVRCGLDRHSAWESVASLAYKRRFSVNPEWHAITRVRKLFSQVLDYDFPEGDVDYGIDRQQFVEAVDEKPYLVFLHGTTWRTKHWPEIYWQQLAGLVSQLGYQIKLPWATKLEKQRADRIAASCESVEVLPRLNLVGVAKVLAAAKAVVAVDTGLGHLSAALDVPAVSLYGPTDPLDIGTKGRNQIHLSGKLPCDPQCSAKRCAIAESDRYSPACFVEISPDVVVEALQNLVNV